MYFIEIRANVEGKYLWLYKFCVQGKHFYGLLCFFSE